MTTYYDPLTHIVTDEQDGLTLASILRSRFALSRKLLSRLKRSELGLTVNGRRVYISERIHTGDRIEVRMEEEQSEDILPQEMPLSILYEDEQLLILNKPAGMVVHPTHGHYTNTLANGVVHYWLSKGERYRFRPIHRLDQDTSGVLAIAKNPYAQQHVSEQMKVDGVRKEYTALVYGVPAATGTVDAPIGRDSDDPHVRVVRPDGAPSVTHFAVSETFAHAAMVRLRLETGRTHQIRVHLKHIGHPIIGDPMYQANVPRPEWPDLDMPRQALHACRLGFTHPATRQAVTFEAPLPDDISEVLTRLRDRS